MPLMMNALYTGGLTEQQIEGLITAGFNMGFYNTVLDYDIQKFLACVQ